MTTTQPTIESPPVLIAGGSLVGLSAAVFLSWHGVAVLVVDKHRGSSLHPRALGYTTRTLEHFRATGVELPSSQQNSKPPRRARVQSLAGTWLEEYPWTPGGNGAYGSQESPVHATAIAQDGLEPILRQRALELGAQLRLGTELLGFTQDADGVTATLRRREDGHEYRLRAQYLVGADGATSGIREALGIARHGQGLLSVQRSILFRSAPIEKYLERGVVQFQIEQPDFQAFLTTYSDGRWVLMLSDDVELGSQEQIQAVQKAVGRTDIPIEIITTGRWELAALIAERFSDGRVFLVGDAAHQLPPNRGGFGANTGIDDAHNLAWKLAAVLNGQSGPALLDSYDAERRPIAQLRHDQLFARADYKAYITTPTSEVRVLDDTAIELGQLYRSAAVLGAGADLPPAQSPTQWAGQPGTRAPHLPILLDGAERSTLDLFQPGWVLLSQDERWTVAATRAGTQLNIPVRFVHIGTDAKPVQPQAFPTAYGLGPAGASLIRPDGYIAWRAVDAPADPTRAVIEALGALACAATNPVIA